MEPWKELTDNREVISFDKGQVREVLEPLVTERFLSIQVNGRRLVRLASSPAAGRELAVGYLISEGLLKAPDDLVSLEERERDLIDIGLNREIAEPTDNGLVNTCIGRGAGQHQDLQPVGHSGVPYTPEILLKLIGDLDALSYTFKKTGGVHSAGLGSIQGLLVRCEDIGRHNAVDKVFGYAFLNRIPLHDKCLVLSGRIAFEILVKAVRNGIPMILSRSAPTLMTVDAARKLGVTIVGFARGDRFNVYSHSDRVKWRKPEGIKEI